MSKWISFYGNAMSIAEHRVEGYSKNITLRYPIYCPFSGSSIRLTFDNFCGTEAITITEASIALGKGGTELDASTARPVTFDKITSVSISSGERIVSDPISFSVKGGETLLVNFYLEGFTQMRSAVLVTGPLSKGAYAVGNHCNTSILPLNDSRNTNWFYFLSDLEILTADSCHSIVCYGDSITAQSWPDELNLLCREQEKNHTVFIRKAASGTRILREYHCITYESYGLKGSHRFPHELPVCGADAIIIQQGINDIIHPVGIEVNPFRPMSDLPSAKELIEGLRYYIRESKKLGMKVYLGTLLPIEGWRTYAPFREELRNAVNDWMRTTDEVDGVIDFAKALADPDNESAFLPTYDSGDHLHPSEAGYRKMAMAAYDILGKCIY